MEAAHLCSFFLYTSRRRACHYKLRILNTHIICRNAVAAHQQVQQPNAVSVTCGPPPLTPPVFQPAFQLSACANTSCQTPFLSMPVFSRLSLGPDAYLDLTVSPAVSLNWLISPGAVLLYLGGQSCSSLRVPPRGHAGDLPCGRRRSWCGLVFEQPRARLPVTVIF